MSRPPPNGPPNGYRHPSNTSNPSLAPSNAGNAATRNANMSRAERFEDEKKRIIESCFSKLDQSGQLAESYITHIRVQEDAQHPSTPPPPESPADAKKPRLIIIAVRSTGRVRMHKARENNNGSFSIGKTWNLEELSAIESFSSSSNPPQSDREAQFRQWAGSVGFTVTITKPYYWQAGTAKEKDFFIASTVKIYRKYTKGQIPELRGFDENTKAQILGAPPDQQPPPQGPPPMGTRPQPEANEPMAPPQPPFAQRPQSREDSRYRGSPGPPPSMSDSVGRGGSGPSSRHESPAPFGRPLASPPPLPNHTNEPQSQFGRQLASPPNVPKPFASTEHLRSNSREAYRDARPGTSAGPGGYTRSPPPSMSQMPRAPSQQSSSSQMRAESPANLSLTSSRGEIPSSLQVRPRSPRKPSYQNSIDEVTGERQFQSRSPPPTMNGSAGAALFQSTQQKWAESSHQRTATPPQVSQLPPLETTRSNNSRTNQQGPQSATSAPKTTESEISSPGMDLADAAAFAAIPDFMGPEHAVASPPPPTVNEPASPPTPERSRRRPPIEESRSDSDLRPAPLAHRTTGSRNLGQTVDGGSIYNIPKDTASSQPPPEQESGAQVQPLATSKNLSDSNLAIPGTFAQSPPGPSPLGTPADTPAEEPKEEDALAQEEEYRPGLGPMIKKKAVADRFKRAATAASAFKPRPGGAAEKILKAKAEREANGEPDGITGVVPRPAPAKEDQNEAPPTEDLAVKEPGAPVSRNVPGQPPTVEVQSPTSPGINHAMGGFDGTKGVQLQDDPSQRLSTPGAQSLREEEEQENLEQRAVRQPQVKVKRRSAQQEQYLAELGVDRSLLADRGLDFEMMLHDFGWNDAALSPRALMDMETNLRREQARLEAGAWLSTPSQETTLREEREKQVATLLDKAIQECDEMDGLLTIYGVELSTLNDDIAYIEAQSQGLQVQAANQRTLHTELTQLVETLSLDRGVFEPLRHADLGDMQGLEDAERCLVRLYEALVKIDPSIRATTTGSERRPKSRGDMNEGSEVAGMKAVRQKREAYGSESDRFCQRVMQHLDSSFSGSFSGVKSKALLPVQGSSGMMRLNSDAFNEVRRGLWAYSPLVLFTKELNRPAWQTMLRMYHGRAKGVYADAFGQNVAYWKRCLRKTSGEEAELLFTTQEKDEAASGGALSSARKLTVKRSQTLAKTLRNASGEKHGPGETRNTGSMTHSEVFSGAVDEMAVLLSYEQNFIVDFFHATSLETADFMDVVAKTLPDQRYGTNLAQQKPLDPDREMARQVTGCMNEIFGFFGNELSSLVEWSVTTDPIQGVGVMACLTRHAFFLQDTSQEFLVQLIESLKSKLNHLFAKFVDEQVRAIEDTKVKIKKRKGLIGFMKTFPHFAAAVENTFAAVGREDYDNNALCMTDVRQKLDQAYDRINRAMFDSLKVIATEGPNQSMIPEKAAAASKDDPEDKEVLNYHVLLIENMNHYVTEVEDGGRESVLVEWRGRAEQERADALDGYVSQVVRRPLGKILVNTSVSRLCALQTR
jgi:exocyst complex component 1